MVLSMTSDVSSQKRTRRGVAGLLQSRWSNTRYKKIESLQKTAKFNAFICKNIAKKRMSKLITVFGATGQQGGSVVRGLLARGGYKIRGVTRNPDGDKAKALKSQGVEIVKGNLDDQASIETAIADAYGVYLVTNYWEIFDKEREIKQGKLVGDACKKEGIKHLIFSGLESVKEITGRDCPHFDGKGDIEKYLENIAIPYTSIRLAAYYESIITLFPKKQDDGSYIIITCMEGPMDGVSVEDLGPVVAAMFSQPEEFIGKKIGLSGDKLTFDQIVEHIKEVTGVTVQLHKLSYEDYAKLGFPGADDIANMFHFYDFGNPDRDIALTKRLNPKVKTFRNYLETNKDNLPF